MIEAKIIEPSMRLASDLIEEILERHQSQFPESPAGYFDSTHAEFSEPLPDEVIGVLRLARDVLRANAVEIKRLEVDAAEAWGMRSDLEDIKAMTRKY